MQYYISKELRKRIPGTPDWWCALTDVKTSVIISSDGKDSKTVSGTIDGREKGRTK